MTTRPKQIQRLEFAFDSVMDGLEAAKQFFRSEATRLLDEQIALENDIYTVDIDRKIAGRAQGRAEIATAENKIMMRFIKASLDVAVAELEQALRDEISRSTKTRSGQLLGSVMMLHAPDGEPYRVITGAQEIKNFGLRDTIALLPTAFYQAFTNSAVAQNPKRGGKGFMVMAAAKIRRKLRIKTSSRKGGTPPGLSVSVGRSRAAAQKIGIPPNRTGRKSGSPRGPIPPNAGAPVIFLRIRGGIRGANS